MAATIASFLDFLYEARVDILDLSLTRLAEELSSLFWVDFFSVELNLE